MGVQSWIEITYNSLLNLWAGALGYLLAIVGALIVILIGLVVAAGLRSLVQKVVDALKLDSALRKMGLDTYFERAGFRINSGKFFGLLVYWFLVIVFVLAASDILNLWGVSMFLRDVVAYVPNVIVAVIIMLAAVIVGNFLRALVRASILSARLHASKFLGTLTWWTVVVFGLLASLLQLGIATTIINTLITGLIAMVALAGGIAFGLGGKEYASHLLERLREETEE